MTSLYSVFNLILLWQINYIIIFSVSNISHYALASGTIALSCASSTYVRIGLEIVVDALASSIHVCHFGWAFYAGSIICFECTLLTYTNSLKLIIRHIDRTWSTFIIHHYSPIHAFADKLFGIEYWIHSTFYASV